MGAKIEDLTPKTKLQGYYEHDYESFLAVLKKNSKKLAVDPARREPGEVLRAEFEGTIGKLGPLLERIEKTDRLIDGCAAVRAHGRGDRDSGRERKWKCVDELLTLWFFKSPAPEKDKSH